MRIKLFFASGLTLLVLGAWGLERLYWGSLRPGVQAYSWVESVQLGSENYRVVRKAFRVKGLPLKSRDYLRIEGPGAPAVPWEVFADETQADLRPLGVYKSSKGEFRIVSVYGAGNLQNSWYRTKTCSPYIVYAWRQGSWKYQEGAPDQEDEAQFKGGFNLSAPFNGPDSPTTRLHAQEDFVLFVDPLDRAYCSSGVKERILNPNNPTISFKE